MTNLDTSARRIRDAFEQDLTAYQAPADLAERARLGGIRRAKSRRLRHRVSAAGATGAALGLVAFLATGAPGGPPTITHPPAIVPAAMTLAKAANVSESLADQSGTADVRIVHNGRPWAGSAIRWSGRDLSVSRADGEQFRLVSGIFYALISGRWLAFSNPGDLTFGSGTSPSDYLATVREDAGGATLHRIVASMTGQTTRHPSNGTTVYSGTVPACVIARTQGHKEGQSIRVLPFGYVAHDEAADPVAPLAVRLTVSADGIIRLISVHWGSSSSVWDYTVTYSGLGHTPAPVAPENATTHPPIDTSSTSPRPSR